MLKNNYFLIFISINIGFSLFEKIDSFYFELLTKSTNDLYFSQNFHFVYLINSYERKKEVLSLIDCLALSSTSGFTKAISYQDLNNSKVSCNLYSSCPSFDSDTVISQSIKSRVYIINNCSSYLGKYIFIYITGIAFLNNINLKIDKYNLGPSLSVKSTNIDIHTNYYLSSPNGLYKAILLPTGNFFVMVN